MSRSEPAEILVAVHFDNPERKAVLVSKDGEAAHAKWLPRRWLLSFHLTGKTTRGRDKRGGSVTLPMAHATVPEWLAIQEGLV